MAALRPLPGKPGKFLDRTSGQVVTLTEARETDRYDTVAIASGAITAGTTYTFFRDLNNKNEIDYNIPEAGKLVTGAERFIIERLGLAIQAAGANLITTGADYKRICAHGFFLFQLNKFEIDAGPMEKFPAGVGLTGMTNENDAAVMNLGVPSTAAQSKFVEQQVVTDQHTVKASIAFQARTWLTTSTLPTIAQQTPVRCYVHGILESAATNN